MVAILFYFIGTLSLVNGLETENNLGSSTLRRAPTKRFFLLPKYLMKHKPLNTQLDSSSAGSVDTPSTVPHMLVSQEMPSLKSRNPPILRDQLLQIRQERQDRLPQESAFDDKEIRELIEVPSEAEAEAEEQARLIMASPSANSISRPCYFSPVQCLLNIPEERINNFVEFVLPVAAATNPDEESAGAESLMDENNRKPTRSDLKLNNDEAAAFMAVANGLLESQTSAKNEVAKSTTGSDESQLRTKSPLRTRLGGGGSLGPNGFGLLPSANPSNARNQPTSAKNLAHMFLTQRHASRLRPFFMSPTGSSTRSAQSSRLRLSL